jgi:hypothetical protein
MSAPIELISSQRWIRLGIAYLALGAGALWYAQSADRFSWFVHGLWCLAGLALAIPTLLSAFRSGFSVVLTDHRLVFLASFSLYFLFGASLPAFGPDLQVESSFNLYPSDPGSVLKVDAINGLGFGVALLMSGLTQGRWLGRQASKVAAHAGRLPYHLVAGLFLAVGIGATAYRIPFDLGFRLGVVSGIVRTLGQLSLVAIFTAVSSRGPHERVLRSLGVMLTVVLALLGAVQFMKAEALLPVVALVAGLALRFGSGRVLPFGLVLLVAVFLLLGNLVNYGRGAVWSSVGASTVAERWLYLQEGWTFTRDLDSSEQYPYWSRLCYVPTQVASIDFHDEGQGGKGLQLMWWVFVPRFLAPNKPAMTAMFGELNEKITGSDLSANSPGIFVSGYYHGGWWGVWLASAVCGWILIQTSAIARAIHAHQAAVMVPFSLLGMFIAFRIDGDFIPDYLGVFMFILYPLLAAALVLPEAARQRAPVESAGDTTR